MIVWLLILGVAGSGIPFNSGVANIFASEKSSLLQVSEPAISVLLNDEYKKSAANEWFDMALEATAREHDRSAPAN